MLTPFSTPALRNEQAVLSICVATYNRAKLLARLLESIGNRAHLVEVVIVDDGSTDDSRAVAERFAAEGEVALRYTWQENAGRASALRSALSMATGQYTVIMDSDDYFVADGVNTILAEIARLEDEPGDGHTQTLVFGLELHKGNERRENLPPNGAITNFTALRADLRVAGDLKEVARTTLLQTHLYDVPSGLRRVPTSLLWTRIAEHANCRCIARAVAVKEYLPSGMTDRILSLKTGNAAPNVELYDLLARSRAYHSRRYRLRALVLRQRYAWHAGIRARTSLDRVLFPVGAALFAADKARLLLRKRS